MDNIRMQRQNGLFFLCENHANGDEELQGVLRNKLLRHGEKQAIFYIKKKEQLLEELKLVYMSHKDLYGNLQEAAWDIMHSARQNWRSYEDLQNFTNSKTARIE